MNPGLANSEIHLIAWCRSPSVFRETKSFTYFVPHADWLALSLGELVEDARSGERSAVENADCCYVHLVRGAAEVLSMEGSGNLVLTLPGEKGKRGMGAKLSFESVQREVF